MKRPFLICLILWCTFSVFAQKERIQFMADSLIAFSQKQPNDTNQCIRYCTISSHYRQLDPEKAIEWANRSKALSQQLQFYKGLQCANNNLGISLYMQGKYPESIAAFTAYKTACVQLNDSINIAWAYNNIGNVYIDLAQYNKTLLYYDSALTIRKLLNDSGIIAQSFTNLGYVYKELGDYTSALVSLYRALQVLERKNDENSLAYCYDFLGSVYTLRKNYTYSNICYEKALALYRKNNQRSGEAIALNTIGTNYYALNKIELGKSFIQQAYTIYKELNDARQLAIISSTLSEIYTNELKPDSALLLAQQSINYHLANNNTRQLGAAYLKLANAYKLAGKQTEALNAANKAYTLSKNSGERNTSKEITQTLSELYAHLGDYANAYKYQEEYQLIKDSILNETSERAIAEMQTKYETEKKDIELIKQASEIKRKQTQLLMAVISIITIIVISFLLYNRYRLKQKAILSATLLEEQSLRNKAIIEAEEKERIRIARELHDGIGQQLSAAKMNLSAFENNISTKDKDTYQALIQLVDDAVKEVRSISHNMMPNALLRSGLVSAVRNFVNKMSISDALKIDLQIVGINNRLENTTETVLYRVLQECVSNIIKHAKASHISIQLIQHDAHLNMMIEDNGIGFDTKTIHSAEGIGLKNMISRIQFLNGTIDFDSSPNNGTTVIIDIPIKNPDES